MSKLTKTFIALFIIAGISFFSFAGTSIYLSIQFNKNCAEYIELAARSTTVDMAKENLGKAIAYAEEKELTTGNSSLFVVYPSNDIAFWYQNLVKTYSALQELDENSALEESNILLKLEALTQQDENGIKAIYPQNIVEYPNHVLFFWWGFLSTVAVFVFLIASGIRILMYEDY